MTDNRTEKFIKGAALLAVAGFIVKLIGGVLRIPLTNIVGTESMAYYSVAYSVYSVFVVLATAGVPVAISRLVSERAAMKHYKAAHKVFNVSIALMIIIGTISFSICFFGADFIASEIMGLPEANMSLKAVAPALFLVPLLAAFRGYFQGYQNMRPTAVSEIVEQLVRVAAGLYLAITLVKLGSASAAAGATFGAAAGAFAGLLVIFIIYLLARKGIHNRGLRYDQEVETTGSIIKNILIIAIPIVIGAEILPIMNTIDAAMIMNRLQSMGQWTYEEAKELYGQYSAYCSSLIALPQIFTQAVAISIVPTIAGFFRKKELDMVSKNVDLGLRITSILASPCSMGILFLAKPILTLLYPSQIESALSATLTLQIMSLGIVFIAVSQTTVGVLQAIGKQTIPVKNLIIGAVFKFIVTYITVGIVAINVRGAAIGSLVAYIITFILNYVAIKKHIHFTVDIVAVFIKPITAALTMGIVAYCIHKISYNLLGNTIATLLAIMFGAIIYFVIIFATKTIREEDMKLVPKGEKVYNIAKKMKLVK